MSECEAEHTQGVGPCQWCGATADQFCRLRPSDKMAGEIERLRAERDALRDVIKGLWSLLLYDYDAMPDVCRRESHKAAREVLNAALRGEGE